ncbi:MAG: 2-methylcitrate dehydratase [Syntrophomonadaceae bacterium]|nr:2-methylcitrate dehydratase [Bacillota bacterium]MBT9146715.1 2-methylcitrate dehydratase [Bacillota bacterium]
MFTEEIAKFITEISYEQLTTPAIDVSKRAILDCVGVTLAGGEEISGKIISEFVRGAGKLDAGVIGEGFKTSVDQAAWANGTKAHALDYDDYFVPDGLTPYHPTVAILPAVLAVGQKYSLSGKDALLAYITGFEVEARVAMACVKQQYELGWHATSTLGSIGATAAIAKMLKLDEEKTRIALGIASSLCGGLRKNFGTMTKPLHAGNAARNGVVAAILAQNSFTADRNILDAPLSFGEVLGGGADHEVRMTDQGVRTEFYIVSPGLAFKSYPSCAYSHWAIDAALELKREAAIEPDNIVEVECRTISGLPQVLIHSHPKTALEGKFSLEFCVAIAVIDGEVSLRQFTDEKVKDSAVQQLMKKIKYVHPPEMGSGLVEIRGEVVVRLQNGKVYSRKVDIAKGNPKNPLSWQDLTNKYRDCVRLSLSLEDTNRVLDLISHLDSVNSIAELMDILTFKRIGGEKY